MKEVRIKSDNIIEYSSLEQLMNDRGAEYIGFLEPHGGRYILIKHGNMRGVAVSANSTWSTREEQTAAHCTPSAAPRNHNRQQELRAVLRPENFS